MLKGIAFYFKILGQLKRIGKFGIPYLRRIQRLIALPYCYFAMVDWSICTASRWQVAGDFVYIFFVLKYFPDNYSLCRLWEKPRSEWVYYYGSIYDAYQKAAFIKNMVGDDYGSALNNKEISGHILASCNISRTTQVCCTYGEEDYISKITESVLNQPDKKYIIKPVNGSGGNGIKILFSESNKLRVRDGSDELDLGDLDLKGRWLVEEFVTQHESLNQINEYCLNTVRFLTLLKRDNQVLCVGACLKFGMSGAYVDNMSQGGMYVAIDMKSGILADNGYDNKLQSYTAHPDSGIKFEGFQLPKWQDVKYLAIETQTKLSFAKFMGLDIGISESGPMVVEINIFPDMVAFESVHGPLLGDREVWAAFKEHDLLINNQSKRLYS